MTTLSAFEGFLRVVRTTLRMKGTRADRIAVEVRDHLESAAEALRSEGYAQEDAEQQALARFGPPDDLVRAFNEADAGMETLNRRLTWRQMALAGVTCTAALAIIVRALDAGLVLNRPVLLSSGTALAILLQSGYALLRPYSVVNCASGVVMALLGVFVMVCHGLFAKSVGLEYDALALALGMVVSLQGSLSAMTAYDHPLLT